MATHAAQKGYPPELRERAVKMARDAIGEQGGQRFDVVHRVARRVGVVVESLRGWLARAEIHTGFRPGTSSTDAAHHRARAGGARPAPSERHLESRLNVFATELDGRPKK